MTPCTVPSFGYFLGMALESYSVRIVDPDRFGDALARLLGHAWAYHRQEHLAWSAPPWMVRACAREKLIALPRQTLAALIRGSQSRITYASWQRIRRLLRTTSSDTARAWSAWEHTVLGQARARGVSVARYDAIYESWWEQRVSGGRRWLTAEDDQEAARMLLYGRARHLLPEFAKRSKDLERVGGDLLDSVVLPSRKALRAGAEHTARVGAKLRKARRRGSR